MGRGARKGSTGGGGASKKWQMNVYDRTEAMAIDVDRGLCQSRDQKGWHGCRSNKGVSGYGKYYYEATVTDEGLCRVGWSTMKAKLDLGTDNQSYGFGGTGKKSFNRQFDSYGETYGLSDVLGCYINLDDMTIKWSKNGVDFGDAYVIQGNLKNAAFFAAVCLKNAELKFNFGDSPFAYPPQGGYQALSKAPSECVVESTICSNAAQVGPAKRPPNAPYAIIIEPSRELAEQTCNQIKKFKKHLKNPTVTDVLLVGGTGAKEQVDTLMRGVDIVVGTPGRMADFISTGKLSLVAVRFFVLDEADGLLAQGNTELINRLHRQIPGVTSDGKRLQMVVCSATLHSFDVRKMADRLMHFPTWIDLKGQDSVPETVHHVVLMVDPRKDQRWKQPGNHITTDEVHAKDRLNHNVETPGQSPLIGQYCPTSDEQVYWSV
ncbi:hypothetical protein NP493_447g05038 [Ridgeia piscesae]|uniref:ATP-dependent RNA helicase DDX1 n=1 Tax=Ridgeia piscesae TaxID=27915 RepID=A0AAD9NRQ9_RIDPI|nr:hypothetical protein NP493_447g05038 [Ridgeia piscesae]